MPDTFYLASPPLSQDGREMSELLLLCLAWSLDIVAPRRQVVQWPPSSRPLADINTVRHH